MGKKAYIKSIVEEVKASTKTTSKVITDLINIIPRFRM